MPARLLGWNFSRSSGPGGQGVNTADSRVELSLHLPSLTGWPEHILWLSLLTLIIARGPGAISLDHLIWTGRIPLPVLARA